MGKLELSEASEETKYYAFSLAITGRARAEIRAKILGRLESAVRVEAMHRDQCRDTDVGAATRVRPWALPLARPRL